MKPLTVTTPKKLIEVALPLDDINMAGAGEKLIKVGKPSNIHLWWARRPLSAARAVIFAQLVNDPASLWEAQNPGRRPSPQQRGGFTQRRKKLFRLVSDLIKWENITNEEILSRAREEIRQSWRDVCELNKEHPNASTLFNPNEPPGLHDPFAGGGAIPLEAQRLGLQAFATDLNPVAVLINKAMIEFPPAFAGRPPVGPIPAGKQVDSDWQGVAGLAEDIGRYGRWVRDEVHRRAGALYPDIEITTADAERRPSLAPLKGAKPVVIAWLWARTVRSPSPAFSHAHVPLLSSCILSAKKGKEVYVEIVTQGDSYRLIVREGKAPAEAGRGTRSSVGGGFRCILSDTPISSEYIKQEAASGRIATRLICTVAEGVKGRIYLDADPRVEASANVSPPDGVASVDFFPQALGFRVGNYGMSRWRDLFTARQLSVLNSFCLTIQALRERVLRDGLSQGQPMGEPLRSGGTGAAAYADAICTYMALAMSRMADWGNSLTRWESKAQVPQQLFGRQAIPMVWDFCEPNPFSESTGSFAASIANIQSSFKRSSAGHVQPGVVSQGDAKTQRVSFNKIVSTDPPYYDNIGYADLSDFFYVWLRPALRDVFPELFVTMAVPKADELVATPARHGGPTAAENFFLSGMTEALKNISSLAHPEPPLTIYYAFKQSETSDNNTSSTGWETFLEAIRSAGLQITGTWPMRMENSSRMRGQSSNALASSVVLVCRRRPLDAPAISRREFIRELNAVLPEALDEMTKGAGEDRSPVAPVDLSQAIIGPGMAVFSKYSAVLEADGATMSVRSALQLINRFIAEDDFDADTQFCLHWFDQYGWTEGAYGDADVLARAKATSVGGLDQAGVVVSGGGKVRLRKWGEYPENWDPRADTRLPVWEALHQLIRAFRKDGETGAGQILGTMKSKAEAIRQLAYRLYTMCERRGWADDARAYNDLVTPWAAIETVANAVPDPAPQLGLFGES